MRVLATAVLIVSAAAIPASAQWITLHTEGVPRTKDGKLNSSAPAPRVNGKPDFSGMWWAGDETRPCPDSIGGAKDCAEKGLGDNDPRGLGLSIYTVNIATNLPQGLPYTEWGRATMTERSKNSAVGDPHVRCLPSNPPRLYTLPHLQRVVQTPKLIVMLNEYNGSYRQIHLDGRALPKDPIPGWYGYSIAHWEKDTLVVETSGFRDDLWLDMRGNPLTSAAKVTERIRRPNFGTLEIELTIDDPKAYTKPWSVTLHDFLVVDTELLEEMCMEGEKSYQHMVNAK